MIKELYDLTGANYHYWSGGRNSHQEYPGGDYEPSNSWTYHLELSKCHPAPKEVRPGVQHYLMYEDGVSHKPLRTYTIKLDILGRRGKGSRLRPVMGHVVVNQGQLRTPSFKVKGKSLTEILRRTQKSRELVDRIEAIQRSLFNPLGCRAVYKLSDDRLTWVPFASDLGSLYWSERFGNLPAGEYLELKWQRGQPVFDPPRPAGFQSYHTTSRGGGSLSGGGSRMESFPPVPTDIWVPPGFSTPIV